MRRGDVYTVTIKAEMQGSVKIEVDATGRLRVVADGVEYGFQLPPYTDRGDIKARWVADGVQISVCVVDNPAQDVFVVPIE